MSVHTVILLLLNALFLLFTYNLLYRYRFRMGSHFGMNFAMITGGGMGISSGIVLINDFPFYYMEITIISTVVGIVSGGLVGLLVDYQSMITGFISGLLSGIMAPMIGAAAAYNFPFVMVIEGFIFCSFFLLIYTAKITLRKKGSRL